MSDPSLFICTRVFVEIHLAALYLPICDVRGTTTPIFTLLRTSAHFICILEVLFTWSYNKEINI
jgi:hypothetical protein